MRSVACILLAGALAAALPAGAQVYRWMDDRGGITYGNQPPPDPAGLTRLDMGLSRTGPLASPAAYARRPPPREFPGAATPAPSAFPGLVDQQTVTAAFRALDLHRCETRRAKCDAATQLSAAVPRR